MKTLKLKKIPANELQAKLIVLKANGIFNDNMLNLVKVAVLNGATLELGNEYSKLLEELNLVENIIEKEEKDIRTARDYLKSEDENNVPKTRDFEVNQNKPNEPVPIEKENNDEIEMVEGEEKARQQEKEEQEKQFAPKTQEEIVNMPPEEVEKMFYLSSERMIESMKRINNGKLWDSLAKNNGNKIELQVAIERAYRSCVYPSDLTNPEFLDKRIGEYLPENNQAIQLKELHMAALMGTYVGYHVEKNEGDIDNLDANGNEKANIAIVKFPIIVDELPETLKEKTRQDLEKAIKDRVKEIMDMSDSYKALMILSPIEKTIDKAMEDYAEGLQETEENKAARAYIKAIRHDRKEEVPTNFDDLNVSLDLYGIDWNNKDTRESVINMVKNIQGEGKEVDVSKFVEEINMSFEVKSFADLRDVNAVCETLSELSEQGIEVNIAFDIPPEQLGNVELQEGINQTVGEYENINRDESTEIVNNGLDYAIHSGVEYALVKEIPVINDPQVMVNAVSMGANALFDISQEFNEPEIGRTLGGGNVT